MSNFELDSILTAYFNDYKNTWEQTRLIAYVTASCFASKELTPQDIIKFNWETKPQETITPEEIEQRKQAMFNRLKENFDPTKIALPKDITS